MPPLCFTTVLLLGSGLLLAGCATPGPNHLYAATRGGQPLLDYAASAQPAVSVPSFTGDHEKILGLAYDSFTDHLFLRLAPGNLIRVVDRPAHAHFNDIPLPAMPPGAVTVALGGGRTATTADLCIRSHNRHLFLADPHAAVVWEFTLFGRYVRKIPLMGFAAPIGGLAFDQRRDRLLALSTGAVPAVTEFDLAGRPLAHLVLAAPVRPISLGYDSDARIVFVPLAGENTIGAFDFRGHLIARYPVDAPVAASAVAAGPRSFLRLF